MFDSAKVPPSLLHHEAMLEERILVHSLSFLLSFTFLYPKYGHSLILLFIVLCLQANLNLVFCHLSCFHIKTLLIAIHLSFGVDLRLQLNLLLLKSSLKKVD